jgi:predicted ATPase/DNA-binding SARP family transcriptional activator
LGGSCETGSVADQALHLTLAGGCRVATADGRWATEVPTRQGRLVLARLALADGQVDRDHLADLIWPDVLPSAWERDLAVVVSKLRRLLGTAPDPARAVIKGGTGAYELILPAGSVVDVRQAAADPERARAALEGGRLDEALITAAHAAETARRPFLPGATAMWVDERREWLRAVLVRALAVQVEVAIRRSDPAGLAAAAEATAVDPTSVRAYANHMRLCLAVSEPAAALAVYRRYRDVVVDELGLPAAPELEALAAAARGGAERATRTDAVTLPVAATSFVGRERSLRDITVAFESARLVTVTGPAGVGKSRLALEAARELSKQHRDGVRTCELAQVSHPTGVVSAVATSLGVVSEPGADVEQSLVAALAGRRMLLLVDNCEHLLPTLVPLLESIIALCPYLCVLATSRERLTAEGETVLPLEPLELPEKDTDPRAAWARPAPALELLADRIAAVRPGFEPMPEEQVAMTAMCHRLDGLPLAIELAAARMASMSAVEVVSRLDRRLAVLTRGRRTAPARHQTLRAAIEWSYHLLDEPERNAFERVSTFLGGFDLRAAERMLGDQANPDQVADLIAALVEKSLLTLDARGPVTRYTMLETLREFACERLAERGEVENTSLAHAEYFAALADQASTQIRGPHEAAWVARLDTDLANMRAAQVWTRRAGRFDLAGRMAAGLTWFAFWRMRAEVFSWAERLAAAAGEGSARLAPQALAAAGRGAWLRGDLKRSELLAQRAIAAAPDDPAARFGWHILGDVGLFSGRLDPALDAFEQADRLAERAGDLYHRALLRGCQALVRSYSGDPAAASIRAAESRALARDAANPTAQAWSDFVTGEVLMTADPDRALTYLERAAATARDLDNEFIRGVAGLSAVSLRARHGDPAAASRAFVDLIDRWERGGNWRQQWTTMRHLVELFVRLGRHQAAGVVLGAIETHDADNVYGADAERLAKLRGELQSHLGPALKRCLDDGRTLERADVLAFVRAKLLATGHP